MRVVSDDGKELIATSERLTSTNTLPEATLRHAQHLNLSFNTLTSLQGLHMATELRNLNVSHNALASLQGIETFQSLRLLRCSGNNIRDLSCLASIPNLRELWVNDNQIERSQVAHLTALRSLETLVLHPNPCTQAVNYVSFVVKTVPWLLRVDVIIVDEELRQQSQHVDTRAFLSSAATDVSEISLMTSRSDDTLPEDPDVINQTTIPSGSPVTKDGEKSKPQLAAPPTPTIENKTLKKKPKKMTAEEFMRAFPVQDFIPPEEYPENKDDSSPVMGPAEPIPLTTLQAVELCDAPRNDVPAASNQEECDVVMDQRTNDIKPLQEGQVPQQGTVSSVSAIANAVLALPSFDDNGILTKKQIQVVPTTKSKKATAKPPPSNPTLSTAPDPALASFQQQEWICTYPNSTVNAIQVRPDGSAVAKWPGGSVAVSVDRERDGFRCYAAHKDGTIALSFDADGVGFINYYPSGRMMISTSSSGDGLYFANEGTILRQWDAQLNMKNDKWEATDKLSDAEPNGSLISKLSDGLGVQLHLNLAGKQGDGSLRPSVIDLKVFFNSGSGIRHAFRNWINKSEANGTECHVIFGNTAQKLKKKGNETRTHTHLDTLHGIRAAVAKLG